MNFNTDIRGFERSGGWRFPYSGPQSSTDVFYKPQGYDASLLNRVSGYGQAPAAAPQGLLDQALAKSSTALDGLLAGGDGEGKFGGDYAGGGDGVSQGGKAGEVGGRGTAGISPGMVSTGLGLLGIPGASMLSKALGWDKNIANSLNSSVYDGQVAANQRSVASVSPQGMSLAGLGYGIDSAPAYGESSPTGATTGPTGTGGAAANAGAQAAAAAAAAGMSDAEIGAAAQAAADAARGVAGGGYGGDYGGSEGRAAADRAGGGIGAAGGDGTFGGGEYNKGGKVTRNRLGGPNPDGPDDGYAALDVGEYVIKADAVKRHGSKALKALNEGRARIVMNRGD